MQEMQLATLDLGEDRFICLLKANSWAPNTKSFQWHSINPTFILKDADDRDLVDFFTNDM